MPEADIERILAELHAIAGKLDTAQVGAARLEERHQALTARVALLDTAVFAIQAQVLALRLGWARLVGGAVMLAALAGGVGGAVGLLARGLGVAVGAP